MIRGSCGKYMVVIMSLVREGTQRKPARNLWYNSIMVDGGYPALALKEYLYI